MVKSRCISFMYPMIGSDRRRVGKTDTNRRVPTNLWVALGTIIGTCFATRETSRNGDYPAKSITVVQDEDVRKSVRSFDWYWNCSIRYRAMCPIRFVDRCRTFQRVFPLFSTSSYQGSTLIICPGVLQARCHLVTSLSICYPKIVKITKSRSNSKFSTTNISIMISSGFFLLYSNSYHQ